MFKFGVLVLLLVLENAIAGERLSKARTDSLVSDLQYVAQYRQDPFRANQSPAQGLQSSSFRRSVNSTGSTCAWDPEHRTCSPSISSIKYLLEKAKSGLAKILVERLTCLEKTNKTDCDEGGSCAWSQSHERCLYADLRRGHEDSPCAKDAPIFFDLGEALTQCPKANSTERCESNKKCIWYSSGGCYVDEDFITCGIKNFSGKVAQVEHSVEATLESEYKALQSADNFTLQALLDYKPRGIECPSGIEQLACDYLVGLYSTYFRLLLYCPTKYKSLCGGCRLDVLCRWNQESAECSTSTYVAGAVARSEAQRVIIDSLPDRADKKMLEVINTCAGTIETRKCTGRCFWNPLDYPPSCRARSDHVIPLLAENQNSTDALCSFLRVDGSSRCDTYFSKHQCHGSKFCRWNSSYQCVRTEELYLSAAANEHPRFKRRYQRFKKRCTRHGTEEACAEPSKVY